MDGKEWLYQDAQYISTKDDKDTYMDAGGRVTQEQLPSGYYRILMMCGTKERLLQNIELRQEQ